MTIRILKTYRVELPIPSQIAEFSITDGNNTYWWAKGNLPLEGDLQTILDSQEARLWQEASVIGKSVPPDIEAQGGAKKWFIDNPNATLLFELSVTDLAQEISNLVDVSFPLFTAGQRAKWKLLLTGLALAVRVLARRLGLL